jgi:hypothetical protein
MLNQVTEQTTDNRRVLSRIGFSWDKEGYVSIVINTFEFTLRPDIATNFANVILKMVERGKDVDCKNLQAVNDELQKLKQEEMFQMFGDDVSTEFETEEQPGGFEITFGCKDGNVIIQVNNHSLALPPKAVTEICHAAQVWAKKAKQGRNEWPPKEQNRLSVVQ